MGIDPRIDALQEALLERRRARHALLEAALALESRAPGEPLARDAEDDFERKAAALERIEARIRQLSLI